jgi:lysyl-tRNA synthetase class II
VGQWLDMCLCTGKEIIYKIERNMYIEDVRKTKAQEFPLLRGL